MRSGRLPTGGLVPRASDALRLARAILATAVLATGCARHVPRLPPVLPPVEPTGPIVEWVQVAPDGRGFELATSRRPFVPWGFNYTVDEHDRLLEDYWDTEWDGIERDFRTMKALGANVVRIHLQFAKLMRDPATPDEHALDQVVRLTALAARTGLYLDVTGLGAYREEDVPAWYYTLSEADRWRAHARFWAAVASRLAESPAVFCYDLMNEPMAPAGSRRPDELLNGELGGFHFLQYIALEQAGRPLDEIARRWIRQLTAAIRRYDRRHLVTVGMLPPSATLGYFSGFDPAAVAAEMDFPSVHIYPERSRVRAAVDVLRHFAAAGKPVVVEETSALYSGSEDFAKFVRQARGLAAGWLGHYGGESPEELTPPRSMRQAIDLEWLGLFWELRPVVSP